MHTMAERVVVCHLGRVAYKPTWDLQRLLQARLVAAKRQDPPAPIPHVFLLVEHPPVYTLGKNGRLNHLLLSEEALRARGAEFFHIDRGGDITFHGPGQLVGYPILDLDRFFTDIHRYLRELEETIIRTCTEYGLLARRVPGRTGVWIGPDARGAERKICAMGIRCSRWVTMHGFAFNLNTDLRYFSYIIPCGIADRKVTSLAAELGRPVAEAEVRARLLHHFARCFEATLTVYEGDEAFAFLEDYLEKEGIASWVKAGHVVS
ncbi:lipoyl(octanoyl) transferase LipB [Rhodothermus profundi]|uniref:Octanoyltransferase n=1 Tax=Rhodothermus profundi TaxID=633813 RepID=A0A1M6QF88_9BACT|nr:lipoyl(octanoyl) transferase LipB [Rhodothermus profundi]SHK18929.1 lipoyl(octanoyl) transferase [Rhodothermus profundi]